MKEARILGATPRTMNLPPGIDECVPLGVAWLDEHKPDWLDKVNAETLDFCSSWDCLLGQVYADEAAEHMGSGVSGFGYVNARLLKGDGDFVLLGFQAVSPWDPWDARNLARAWAARIEQLRAERGES